MGCDCARTISPEQLIDNFWKELKIREIDIEDVTNMTRSKKGKANQIKDNKFRQFIEGVVENPQFHEESIKIFLEALKESRVTDEGYFFVAILFLASSTLEKFVMNFTNIWKAHVNLKNTFFDETENKKMTIKTKNLRDVVFLYCNMISKIGVPFIAAMADNKQDIIDYFEKPFSEDNVLRFVDETFFKNIEGNEIEVEKFFKDNLEKLKNDSWIRSELMK